MQPSRGLLSVVLAASFSALALTPRSAPADTFTLHTVDATQSENFHSGDDLGDFVITVNNSVWHPCGVSAANCFKVGSIGSSNTYYTASAPVLGKGATIGSYVPTHLALGANWDVTGELGGIFAATYSSATVTIRGLFDGADPMKDYLGTGSIDGGLVSAGGTVFFNDGLNNTLVVALDTSTAPAPEPGTITLFGTGGSGLLALLSRRRQRPCCPPA